MNKSIVFELLESEEFLRSCERSGEILAAEFAAARYETALDDCEAAGLMRDTMFRE